MTTRDDIARYRENLNAERDAVALYEQIAGAEPNPDLAAVYQKMAETERRHAKAWEGKLQEADAPVPDYRPGWRTRILGWLARRFGAAFVLPTMVEIESAASSDY